MGDAGYILFGPIGREVLAGGTVIFAVFGTGGQILAGQIALAALSSNKLCLMLYTGIFAIPTLLCALPRTLDSLSWLSIPSVISILVFSPKLEKLGKMLTGDLPRLLALWAWLGRASILWMAELSAPPSIQAL